MDKKDRTLQQYYTDCNYITSYMMKLLDVKKNESIIEPCAGEGAFIKKIIDLDFDNDISAIEIDKKSIDFLKHNYKNINLFHKDFLNFNEKKADKIIGNPPYGAIQSVEKKKELKKTFKGFYVKETYTLFILHSLNLLKENGRLVFIVPDTFMNLHMHKKFRNYILNQFLIESITLFSSKFFPGVNFGYAGLAIISIKKTNIAKKNIKFPVFGKINNKNDFLNITADPDHYLIDYLTYEDCIYNESFYLTKEKWMKSLFVKNHITINNVGKVVTGFYSGDDKNNLKRDSKNLKYANRYSEINNNYICKNNKIDLDGIDDSKCYVSIVKGGNIRFNKPDLWYMNWSRQAVSNYKISEKSRFQNSEFYFKQGLAIPMISSKRITCSLINQRLFDQSIVGVFLYEKFDYLLLYFLGFFNSKLCNKLIRTINSSTNNSANYIKKIPIIIPEKKELKLINKEVSRLLELSFEKVISDNDLHLLDKLFYKIYCQ